MTVRRDDRRADAHLKIQLGGLIIKAGLATMPRDQLLGLLLDGKERARDPDAAGQFAKIGERAFRS